MKRVLLLIELITLTVLLHAYFWQQRPAGSVNPIYLGQLPKITSARIDQQLISITTTENLIQYDLKDQRIFRSIPLSTDLLLDRKYSCQWFNFIKTRPEESGTKVRILNQNLKTIAEFSLSQTVRPLNCDPDQISLVDHYPHNPGRRYSLHLEHSEIAQIPYEETSHTPVQHFPTILEYFNQEQIEDIFRLEGVSTVIQLKNGEAWLIKTHSLKDQQISPN